MSLELPSWAVVSPARTEHIARVVALAGRWAQARGVSADEAARWHKAATLHDALKDAGPAELERYVPRGDWPQPLWHGPAAAEAAEQHGERDRGVLDAVRYHSVGFAGWDEVGRVLYLADYLEEGRRHAPGRRAALAARVPQQLHEVLVEVAAERLAWLLAQRKPVKRESWDFWNQLIGAGSSS